MCRSVRRRLSTRTRGDRRRDGTQWERFAKRILTAQGLQPVTENVSSRFGEIDLIMLDAAVLSFVEVRFRRAGAIVDAAQSVDSHKQRKLALAAQYFLAKHPRWQRHVMRFDVFAIDQDSDGNVGHRWLRDAFRPQ